MKHSLIFVLLAVVLGMANAMPADEEYKPNFALKAKGAPRTLASAEDLNEAKEAVELSLKKAAPHYTLRKINSATKQVVAGSKFRINADLIEEATNKTKTCNITIWQQPWEEKDGVEVTFEFEGEEAIVKKHNFV